MTQQNIVKLTSSTYWKTGTSIGPPIYWYYFLRHQNILGVMAYVLLFLRLNWDLGQTATKKMMTIHLFVMVNSGVATIFLLILPVFACITHVVQMQIVQTRQYLEDNFKSVDFQQRHRWNLIRLMPPVSLLQRHNRLPAPPLKILPGSLHPFQLLVLLNLHHLFLRCAHLQNRPSFQL